MMSNQTLPVVGASLYARELELYLPWLMESQRDVEIRDFSNFTALDGDWHAVVQTVKQRLDGHQGRLGIHGPMENLTLAAQEKRARTLIQDRFKQSLEICAALEATHMVIHSPLIFIGAPVSNKHKNQFIELSLKTMHDIVKIAEAQKCTLVIENIYDRSPQILSELVQSFKSDYVRQSLDCGHAYVSAAQGGAPPDQYIYEAKELLTHVHLQDTDGYTDRHWHIGSGSVHWGSIFAALRQVNVQPRLILELFHKPSLYRSVDWLKANGLAQ